jgi:hypothetical protein
MSYITCNHKKAKSKISVWVCEKCWRKGSCQDYFIYKQPLLFPNLEKIRHRKTYKPMGTKPGAKEIIGKREQLKIF